METTLIDRLEDIDAYEDPGAARIAMQEAAQALREIDPTPWCTGCGARKRSDCHCGPIASNE